MKNVVVCFFTILIISVYSLQASAGTYLCTPKKVSYSDVRHSKMYDLSKKDQFEYRMIIKNQNDKYYWVSRGNNELVKQISGIYLYFIPVNGSGLIKISTLTGEYFEIIHLHLQTITYFGHCE